MMPSEKANKRALENPCETVATYTREQIRAYTAKKRAY